MINKKQLESLVIRTLEEYKLFSEEAVNLIIGTIAQESRGGTYIRQLNDGPARGIAQIEKPTFDWLKDKFQHRFGLEHFEFEQLEWDLKASILFCRLRYLAVPEALPTTIGGMATYWKKYYNTVYGGGTEAEYIINYQNYIKVKK